MPSQSPTCRERFPLAHPQRRDLGAEASTITRTQSGRGIQWSSVSKMKSPVAKAIPVVPISSGVRWFSFFTNWTALYRSPSSVGDVPVAVEI